MSSSVSSTGLGYSILASLMFGLIPWYVQWLDPLDGYLLFSNRILFSAVTALAALLVLGELPVFLQLLKLPGNLLWLSAGTGLVGFQWWLFVWAPMNDLTTELSLGYFLLPLTLVLTGRVVYGEHLRPLQLVGTLLAAIGVSHEIYRFGSLSWVAVAVAIGYPLYFLIRRKVRVNTLACFMFENLLLLPFAMVALVGNEGFWQTLAAHRDLYYLLPGLGVLCTLAMLIYIAASKALPVSLFGLLSYLEPAIIFLVAVVILQEPFPRSQWLTYGFIWLATAIICIDSIRLVRKPVAA